MSDIGTETKTSSEEVLGMPYRVTQDQKASFDKYYQERNMDNGFRATNYSIKFEGEEQAENAIKKLTIATQLEIGVGVISGDGKKIEHLLKNDTSFTYVSFGQEANRQDLVLFLARPEVSEARQLKVANSLISASNELSEIYGGPKLPILT